MIKTAVVILNWNGKKYLEQFLGDIIMTSSSANCRVYVADNGSKDDSCEYIRNNHPEAVLLEMDRNHGFAGGYNEALKNIDSEYFVLLNSDIKVSPGWLSTVTDYMDNNPEVAACQPKILSYHEPDKFEYAGAAGGYIDKYGYPFCRGRIMNITEADNGQYDNIRQIFWASGACMFIRSSVWKETGGFDPDFFAHMEEIDLCWRINATGRKIMFIPGSVVYHIGGGTLPYHSPAKVFYNFRNNLYLLYKNLPDSALGPVLFKRRVLDGIAAIRFLLTFNIKAFSNVIKAHTAFYRHKKVLRAKRKENISLEAVYPGKLVMNKSLVFSFYIKRKKTYSELFPE
ncbi:MAG: glycosyltransferase family 2 protein [Bacteroidales bacterium]|nr:glycosyltransferase family 2 protein [Bacteroidales bacterium]